MILIILRREKLLRSSLGQDLGGLESPGFDSFSMRSGRLLKGKWRRDADVVFGERANVRNRSGSFFSRDSCQIKDLGDGIFIS